MIISILVLALALTLSTIDTLINAISSILIVNGNQISKSIFVGIIHSTKKIEDEIFKVSQNIRSLKSKLEDTLLEYNYLILVV